MKHENDYYTYDAIMQRKMDRIPSTLDKREGSIIHTAIAPDSALDAEIYEELILRYNEGFADTSSREYLIRRCKEQGLEPYPSTKAIVTATFTGATPSVGSRFNVVNIDVSYILTSIVNGTYYLTCEQYGTVGNLSTGRLIPIVDISGLTSANITSLYSMGDDAETTEHLRQRYFDVFNFQRAFAGNVAGFVELTNALDGVGATKVIRAWNGGGTCKLVILNDSLGVPSSTIVTNIQNQIDPTVSNPNDSGGLGLAPIFCKTTVVGAGTTTINVTATITYTTGHSWSDTKTAIFNAIDSYFTELKTTWQNEDNTMVKITRVLMAILGVTGVSDVSNVKINNGSTNITLDADKIPILGTINGESR